MESRRRSETWFTWFTESCLRLEFRCKLRGALKLARGTFRRRSGGKKVRADSSSTRKREKKRERERERERKREMHTSDFRHIRAGRAHISPTASRWMLFGSSGSSYLAVFQTANFLLAPKPLAAREAATVRWESFSCHSSHSGIQKEEIRYISFLTIRRCLVSSFGKEFSLSHQVMMLQFPRGRWSALGRKWAKGTSHVRHY